MREYRIDLAPIPKGRPRFTKTGHAFTPAKTRKAEDAFKIAITEAWNKPPMEGALDFMADFYIEKPKSNKTEHHTQRPDLDNYCKLLWDAMNGIVFLDDAQIVDMSVTKQWTNGPGYIVFAVEPHG